MIVFSVISNFWYPFGVFLLQLHFTHVTWKIVTPFSLPKILFKILSCQLKFSKQRSGFTFLRTLVNCDRNDRQSSYSYFYDHGPPYE